MNPYENCPAYETSRFTLRMVRPEDAEALLKCYSDPRAVRLMNADTCTSDFYYQTLEEMEKCVAYWLYEYKKGYYVRFAIVLKEEGEPVGTVEMLGADFKECGRSGLLRVDLRADCEREDCLEELYMLALERFAEDFDVPRIMTKAIPEAVARVAVLRQLGFEAEEAFRPGLSYWAKTVSR